MVTPSIDFHRNPFINPRKYGKMNTGGTLYPYLEQVSEPTSEVCFRSSLFPPYYTVNKNVSQENQYTVKEFNEMGSQVIPTGTTLIPTLPIPTMIGNRSRGQAQIPFNVVRLPASPRTFLPIADVPVKTQLIKNNLSIGEVSSSTWGVSQQQQRAGEDRYQAKLIGPFRYFAVFDGHGGARQMGENHVGDYAVNNLHVRISNKLGSIDLDDIKGVSNVISQVFVDFDDEMYNKEKDFGSTCTVILIDDDRNRIYQINLGDSRSIIFNDNGIISVTDDHEPEIPNEEQRIKAAGGFVTGGRVNGQLMVSRAFGDFHLKRNKNVDYDPINGMVSAVPDIKIIPFNNSDKRFNVILTSDAPYERDAFNDTNLVNMALNLNPYIPKVIAQGMVQTIYPRTTDDTTIMYVII